MKCVTRLLSTIAHFEVLKQHIENQASAKADQLDIENGQAAIQRGRQLIDIILRGKRQFFWQGPILTSIHKAVNQEAVGHYGFENESSKGFVYHNMLTLLPKLNETLFNFVIFNLIRNTDLLFWFVPG